MIKKINGKLMILIFLGVFGLSITYILFQGKQECIANDDCKLIYSNCGCEAAPVADTRDFLESRAVCVWNDCHGTNVTAVCQKGKCRRSK